MLLSESLIRIIFGLTIILTEAEGSQEPESNHDPRLAVFLAPFPFAGRNFVPQLRSLNSITNLSPSPSVYLLGNHLSFQKVSEALGSSRRIKVLPHIDCSAKGIPFFNSIIYSAGSCREKYVAVILPKTEILGSIEPLLSILDENPSTIMFARLRIPKNENKIEGNGSTKTIDVGLWLWKTNPEFPASFKIPPFSYLQGSHDFFLGRMISASMSHSLMDVSDQIMLREVPTTAEVVEDERKIHQSLQKLLQDRNEQSQLSLPNGTLWPARWTVPGRFYEESVSNRYWLKKYSKISLKFKSNRVYSFWKLRNCESDKTCLEVVHCQQRESELSNPDRWGCENLVTYKSDEHASQDFKSVLSEAANRSRLEFLLPRFANANKTVIMTGGTFGYKDIIMNFVCNLRKLHVQNPLVVAFDRKMYKFGVMNGLAMVFHRDLLTRESDFCSFHSDCFNRVTKFKSIYVLEALKQGFNVLWSDADVVWFRDPLADLYGYGPNALPIQSDAPWKRMGGPYRLKHDNSDLNSGFYFARSRPSVIRVFKKIVEVARTSNSSEQPVFNLVMCGLPGFSRKRGKTLCSIRNSKLNVVTLPRKLYPNGAVVFFSLNQTQLAEDNSFIVHNNYVLGKRKIYRLKALNLWLYKSRHLSCECGEPQNVSLPA